MVFPARWLLGYAAAVLLLALAGCGRPGNVNTAIPPDALNMIFTNGDAQLNCRQFSCAGDYGGHREDLKKFYDSGDWHDLAAMLLSIGFDSDQSWFYLASAAQGLGYQAAAQRYYFISMSTFGMRCKHPFNTCDGLDLPALTQSRLMALNTSLLATPAFAQLGNPAAPPNPMEIHLANARGMYLAPALLNGKIPLLFAVDSGASLVNIPDGVAILLIKEGALPKTDILGVAATTLANGATLHVLVFRIHSLQVGNLVLHNVLGTISGRTSELLLGQTFLKQFKSWSMDNAQETLVLAR